MSPLPSDADDPRLEGWYHTIELAPGIWTRKAVYDHRPILERVGLPDSLEGKTALDIGTADGFWAFEMERRGADRVVAFDIARVGDSDVLPSYRANLPEDWADSPNYCAERFWTAHAMRKSRVEYQTGNIYSLDPETIGQFDIVYCGSLLVHLFNPLLALIKIRSVTREMAIVEACSFNPDYDPIEAAFPDRPYAWFGSLDADEGEPGKSCMYWRFTERALHDILIYAGFAAIESRGFYRITGPGGGDCPVTAAIGYVQPREAATPPPETETQTSSSSYEQLRTDRTNLFQQNQLTLQHLDELRAQLQQQAQALAEARAQIARLQAELNQFGTLGPRSLQAARRLQWLSHQFPRISSAAHKISRF